MENLDPLACDFIRFCHQRCGGEWPELYDEMCRVAGQRLFRGIGYSELYRMGVALDLSSLDTTFRLVERVTGGPVAALAVA